MLPAELLDTVVPFDDDAFRNIKSIRESQDLFDDLSPSKADRACAQAASEGPASGFPPLIARPFDYGTVITFPFVPENWHVTRFSDGTLYGVWYGSLELETTVHETVYHWVRFVRDSFPDYDREIRAERRLFRARVNALLVDLRGKEAMFPGLVDPDSYGFTHPVGRYLHEQRQNGLLVKSARCDGTNCNVFAPEALSNVRDVCYLTYRFVPTATQLAVERASGRRWLRLAV
ncbi:RES domain protein [Sulfurifustis variabilis]|uniref:RES domain protein n=1 Tax=Sulfurifustis variabilis TaxID=1675686 RepID=A0A1B4V357_9GAMM|nr:RES family NAD+ phosphorylase [Sulfurifustis variabilis]BAU47989.1 RES domain protein [Sulfurifustis variabilis]